MQDAILDDIAAERAREWEGEVLITYREYPANFRLLHNAYPAEVEATLAKHGIVLDNPEPVEEDPNAKVRLAYKYHGGAGWKRVIVRRKDLDRAIARLDADEVLVEDA